MSLCKGCRFFEYADFESGKTYAYCKKLFIHLRSSAIHCRYFQPKNQPSIDDMYSGAWILTKSKEAGYLSPTLGFSEPEKRRIRRTADDFDR